MTYWVNALGEHGLKQLNFTSLRDARGAIEEILGQFGEAHSIRKTPNCDGRRYEVFKGSHRVGIYWIAEFEKPAPLNYGPLSRGSVTCLSANA